MQIEQLQVDVHVDIRKNSTQNLGVTLMSRDINNYSFYLRVLQDGELLVMDETYEVEVLSLFTTSKSKLLTKGTIKSHYVDWKFDPAYISKSEVVKNYVYVRKDGELLISADANCFIFEVGLSAIDSDVGRVAEVYDENYEKVLLDYSGALDDRTTERLDDAVLDFNQRGDSEIADWRVDADVELEDYLADRVVLENLIENGDFSDDATGWLVVYNKALGSVVNNKYSFIGLPSGNGRRCQDISATTNDKLYVALNNNIISGTALRLEHSDYGLTVVTNPSVISRAMESGLVTAIINAKTNGSRVAIVYEEGETYNSTVDNVIVINLTQTFGAGNEPTKEWMDRLIEKTGYFDEHILDEKWQVGELLRLDDTKADKIVVNNLVTNGDFSDGSNDWLNFGDRLVVQVTQNGLLLTAEDLNGSRLRQSVSSSKTDLWYHSARLKVNSGSAYLGDDFSRKTSDIIPTGGWEVISYRDFYLREGLPAAYPSIVLNPLSEVEVDWLHFINLTQAFGAGNEPSKEWMDRLIEQTGYFDEHVLDEVGEMLRLDDTKANKVQEDWITPTLLNGWTEVNSSTTSARFMKDEFGFVHLKGQVQGGSPVMLQLPPGYRSNNLLLFPVYNANRMEIDKAGYISVISASGKISLDGIHFKAEG